MRRTLVLLLLLTGIAAVALLLILDQDAPRKDGEGSGAAAASADPARGDPLAGSGAGAEAERQPGIERSGANPGTAVAAPAADADLLEIEVLRSDDRAPVAGAEVLVADIDEDRWQPLMDEFFLGASVDGILNQFAARFVAGPDGKVLVPMPGDYALLAGRKEQFFGILQWDGREAEGPGQRATIEVERTRDLRIRVRDENGQPAPGVTVALRVSVGDDFSMDLLRARTGPDGLGSIAHAGAFAKLFPFAEVGTSSAALAAVLPEPVGQEIDLAQLPAEPVELRLPPTGSVIVKLRTADGAGFHDPLLVALSKAREDHEDSAAWQEPGMPGFDAVSQRMPGGEFRFDHVGLGLTIQASAAFPGAPRASVARAPGPQRPGETVVLDLVEQRDFPVLLAQFLDAAGQPLAGELVQVELMLVGDELDWSNQHAIRTDAEGRIRLGIMPVSEEEAAVAIAWRRDAGAGGLELQARTELARPLKVGENDVGSVRMTPAPILASGRVLDPQGRPVEHASVAPARRVVDEYDPGAIHLDSIWERERETDEQGGFTLTGSWPDPDLVLEVEANGYLPVEQLIAPGAQNLEIRLARSYKLSARLIVDPGVDIHRLEIELESPGSEAENDTDLQFVKDAEGRDGLIEFSGAQPGYADLVIRIPTHGGPEKELLRISGILVGGASADPRLDPIDLRGKIYGCKILARGEDGSELEDLEAWPVANPASSFNGWNGSVSLLSSRPFGAVQVNSPGWRPARLTPAHPIEEVVLVAGLEVRISSSATAPDGYRLGVMLSVADSGSWMHQLQSAFDASGNAHFRVSTPGVYEAIFTLSPPLQEGENEHRGGGLYVPLPGAEARQRIEVQESGAAQSFRLTAPSAELIAQTLDQLRSLNQDIFDPF